MGDPSGTNTWGTTVEEYSFECKCTLLDIPRPDFPPLETIENKHWERLKDANCRSEDISPPKEWDDYDEDERKFISSRINCCVGMEWWVLKINECKEEDSNFPEKALNQQIHSTWTEDLNNTQICLAKEGTVQEAKKDCNSTFRCLTKTDSCPTIPVESVASYVNPRDGTFHEDIALDGLNFGLHYKSSDFNSTNTFAKGWSITNHHTYLDGKLHLGGGTVLVATATSTEDENILINSGGEVYVFDATLKHIETRDAYTKKKLFSFGYENEKLVTVTDEFTQTTNLMYDADGVLNTIVAPHGQTTAFAMDVNADLLEVQYEDGSSYAFEYENHLMTKETEPNGNIFLHLFDAEGKVTKVIDAEQGEWSFNNDVKYLPRIKFKRS